MNVSRCLAVLAIVGALTLAAHADLKITTKNTMPGGQSTQGTTYIKGQRQRSEMQFGPMKQVTITQCDRRQSITISDACRTYMVNPIDQEMDSQAPPPNSRDNMNSGQTRRGGTMTINVSTTNTGETRQMFGYNARHIKTRMSITSSPDACNPNNMTMESDGWYTDFAGAGLSCSAMPRPQGMGGRSRPDCQDRIRYTGNMRNNGYPMKLTTTMEGEHGTFTMTQETTELSRATLNPALFDVPSGYREVNDYQGLMCQAAYSGGGNTPNIPEEAPGEQADNSRDHHRRHGSGALCVAPVTNKSDASFDSEAWRDMLIGQLARVRVQAVKLNSSEQFDLRKEAYQQGCHLVLYTDVNESQSAPGRRVGRPDYRTSLHMLLMPDDEYQPWLDNDVQGNGASIDNSAENAMRSEAQQVATELSQHR